MIRSPYECESAAQARREIDRLDRELIHLLKRRADYVAVAARHASTDEEVCARERVAGLLADRREWAACDGVSPELVERLYRLLVNHAGVQEQREAPTERAEPCVTAAA